MLCSQLVMRKDGSNPEELRPLPCRSWSCEYCAPQRRRQLMYQAAAGEPNKFLTLTVNPHHGETPSERRDMLHNAWKKLVKRINRQLLLPIERRWQLQTKKRSEQANSRLTAILAKDETKIEKSLPYFAFLERTKRGEPHLHILLRCPYIPQDWISEQMQDLIGAPICDIREVNNTRQAIGYVTKYCTKEPAQFGNKKRYWRSRNWETNKGDDSDDWRSYNGPVHVERISWRDLIAERVRSRWTIEQTVDGWYRFYRPGAHPDWEKHNPDLANLQRKQDAPHPQPP